MDETQMLAIIVTLLGAGAGGVIEPWVGFARMFCGAMFLLGYA